MRLNIPPTRLRDFQVGDCVRLIGAEALGKPCVITAIEDGYYALAHHLSLDWVHLAAGSHLVEAV